MWSFGMCSNFSCYQLKIAQTDIHHGNHKAKTYSKYTKENEKGV